jgi:hypothetical protein
VEVSFWVDINTMAAPLLHPQHSEFSGTLKAWSNGEEGPLTLEQVCVARREGFPCVSVTNLYMVLASEVQNLSLARQPRPKPWGTSVCVSASTSPLSLPPSLSLIQLVDLSFLSA